MSKSQSTAPPGLPAEYRLDDLDKKAAPIGSVLSGGVYLFAEPPATKKGEDYFITGKPASLQISPAINIGTIKMADPNSEDLHESVSEETPDPAIAEIGSKKKPRTKKVSSPTTNAGNGQRLRSDAKLREMAHEAAAPAADILSRKPIPLNPRLSDRFRINPQTTTIGTKREILKLPVRAPNKYEHVRVHPTLSLDVMVIRPEGSKETYVIDTCMHDILKRWTTPATLRLAITSDDTHLVWPLRFPACNEKDFAAWTSARSIARDAETGWCSLIWNARPDGLRQGDDGR